MSRAKHRVLISWIGGNDLKALDGQAPGPIAATLQETAFDSVELLYNYPDQQVKRYLRWLGDRCDAPIHGYSISLSSPVNFGEIYQAANLHLNGRCD